jgi:hypothetical protein
MNRFRFAVVCLLACGVVLLAASRYQAPRQCIGIAVTPTERGSAWLYRGFSDGSVERALIAPWSPEPKEVRWLIAAPADLAAPAGDQPVGQ